MARSFHRRRSLAPVSELNVTSLIDLGFSLLIIFMISTPLIKNESALAVDLPVSSDAAPPPSDQKFVDITIQQGGYVLDDNPMDRQSLEAILRTYAASPNPPVISIRADRTVQYQEVVTLLDLCKKYNLSQISLETQTGR
ncbi:protein TolR [Opitutales bacterium ASA1]|uniref:ExbD/TolR family protein n=1 Tax=Congregicoccus parvus TaxID=3081749 RepID=UPI002B2EC10D|nr:protein TolR [Opitutales bacterium ASA1]